jgi:hypothetical protein
MNIIGLDLSTVATGYVHVKDGLIQDVCTFKAKDKDVHKRIYSITKQLSDKIPMVDMVMIEAIFNIKWNTQSLLELRGAIINILVDKSINYSIITANEARSITKAIPKGNKYNRDEKKVLIREVVEKEFNYKFSNFDESDAALLCLAYIKKESK